MFDKFKNKISTMTSVVMVLAFGLGYSWVITNERLQPWLIGGIIVSWIILREH